MAVSAARGAAFDILVRVERESSYAGELLHSAGCERLSTADHALATELVMGVLRWRGRLDEEIGRASSQPIRKLDLEVVIALRMALYQFRYLSRVPQRAALHESVELVKRARKRSAAAFVNAVLRKLSGGAAVTAVGSGSAEEIAETYSHPLWLVERWIQQYGVEAARRICEHDQTVPATSVRLRAASAESELSAEGISVTPGRLLDSARQIESGDVTKSGAFRAGHVVIQDEGSQLIAALVGSGHSRILDCCAAPGGKTLAIADQNAEAAIVALEIHGHRARVMRKLFPADCGRIRIVVGDARALPVAGRFDCVLADVPCSGTGTLARNPEIKWRLRADDLTELHGRQVEILRSAAAQLESGGRLIYSTCSLEKEENEDVVDQVLKEDAGLRVMDCRGELDRLKSAGVLRWADVGSLVRGAYLRTIPGVHPCDGFFGGLLERS